jgi:hypothetical protein
MTDEQGCPARGNGSVSPIKKRKRVSRKGAGGAKEERKVVEATYSWRVFLCAFAPLREMLLKYRVSVQR